MDSVRSRLFAALRTLYQERDRLRLLLRFRKAFIARLLARLRGLEADFNYFRP